MYPSTRDYASTLPYPPSGPIERRSNVRHQEHDVGNQYPNGARFYGTIKTPGANPIYLSTTAVSAAKARSNFIAQYAAMKNMYTSAMFRAIALMGAQFTIEISQEEPKK